ncbi:CAAX prenyl protease 1, putative [Theileria equi strain WA]|uniref:CAAX prenyl protease n=1 Tax=Theileria equi strain WA TaxID=1537102 RepID=L1LDW9_THEEQ|nr:CAAX prenyl protease 1, putative [Theileria equi strain WA]EKX73445.1 CAAX prenyl protease 1, putative [Theileria equi strain WA]|eukprot:XP_004832897.1 CAAX prenyl protease 1, putative [Theileria equi strain WA]
MGILNLFEKPIHFEFFLTVSLLHELFEQYLNFRQLAVIRRELSANKKVLQEDGKDADEVYKRTVKAVNELTHSEDYVKNVEYGYDKLRFQIFSSIVHSAFSLFLLFSLFGPALWHFSGSLFSNPNEYTQSLVYCGLKMLIDALFEIPFGLYSDFFLEEKHGFNKKTLKLFFKDLALSLVLYAVIGGPTLCVLIFLVNWGGDTFYFYAFGFVVVFNFIMLIVYPEFIAPLFNKYEPLKDQELKAEIEALAKKLKFPLMEIKQMDGSKRSSHSNMYFYGIWKFKRIVVYDTILTQPKEQIVATVAHELGHWSCNHYLKHLSFSFLNIFLMFFIFNTFKNDASMFESFGFHGVNSFVVGITLFSYILTPMGIVMHIAITSLTRYNEYQADGFAVKLGYGEDIATSLVQLHKNNKGLIHHDPLYSWYHFTHPALFERLHAIYRAIHDNKI